MVIMHEENIDYLIPLVDQELELLAENKQLFSKYNTTICLNDKDKISLIQDKYKTENVDVCILDYDYVTGASWGVEKSTNKDIENEYVCLNTICNPRLLKINKEFDLDYMAKYVVVIDKNITQTKVDDEDVGVLKVKEIVITDFYYENDGFDDMRFGDLSFGGKAKAILSLFVPKLRLQI